MITDQQKLLILKGFIADMGSTEQASIRIAAERIRALLRSTPVAICAVWMVALEAEIDPQSLGLQNVGLQK